MVLLTSYMEKVNSQASSQENEKNIQIIFERIKLSISDTSVSREELLIFLKSFEITLISLLNSDHFEIGFSTLFNLLKFNRLLYSFEGFPFKKFGLLVKALLNCPNSLCIQPLLSTLFNNYCDIKYYVLKLVVSSKTLSPPDVFTIISLIDADSLIKASDPKFFLIEKESNLYTKIVNYKIHKSLYSKCWMILIKSLTIPENFNRYQRVSKRVLLKLNERTLKSFTQPLLLSEFFTAIFSKGGIYSILSLNGLFFLIRTCNFECPSFFQKLFEVLTPNLFGNHRVFNQFSKLIIRLLKSKYLTNSAAASIIKQLMVISLGLTPNYFKWIIPIIYNMLKERPSVRTLIQSENDDINSFYNSKLGIEQSNAENTSLWEIPSLEKHYYKPLGKSFKLFSERLLRPPYDLREFSLQSNYSSIKELYAELKHKWTKKPHTNLEFKRSPF
jgi:hypothetical protein